MHYTVQTRSWCAILFFVLGAVFAASAAEYEVDGEIVQTAFKMDGSIRDAYRGTFTVFVDGCSWLIQMTNQDGNGKPYSWSETAFTNGGEIYALGGVIKKEAWMPNHGWICSNNVPVGEGDININGHLWLMFASGCYFKSLTTNRITPVYDCNASVAEDPKMRREARWELFSGPASLPSNVVYIGDIGVPIDAIYWATGVTNTGKLQMASGFEFERRIGRGFAPGPTTPGRSIPDYGILSRATATVTAVRPGCSRKDLLPTAEGFIKVIDERLSPITGPLGPRTYDVREGSPWILPVEKARKLYFTIAPQEPPSARAREVFLVAMFSVTAVFLFIMIRLKKRQI